MTQDRDRAARRRAEIVEAATRVFANKGYQSTTIADIAGELGIGHGTVYRYFEDKRDLFAAVIGDVVQKITGSLAGELPGATTLAEYRAQVERIGEALYALFTEHRELAQLAFVEAPAADADIAAQVDAAMQAFAQLTEAYLQHGASAGYLRADIDTRVVATAINAMILAGARTVLRAEDPEAEKNRWVKQIPEVFLNGIAAKE